MNSTYCGNYPDKDHSNCPSSIECYQAEIPRSQVVLENPNHGTFRVYTDHLESVRQTLFGASTEQLVAEIHSLVGVIDGYEDLTRFEAYIVLSYLTNGKAF